MVVLDDRIEQRLEESVSLSIRCINSTARIQIRNTGLDDIQQSGSQFGTLILELVNNFFAQVPR